jgi:hypothetical protein
MRLIYFLLPLILQCFHCSKKHQDFYLSGYFPNSHGDSLFKREIPITRIGELDPMYVGVRKISDQIALDRLVSNGFDSLQIRIWYPERKKRRLYVIKYSSRKVQVESIDIITNYDSKSGEEIVTVMNKHEPIPKTGESGFFRTLLSLGVHTVPDESQIIGFNGGGADGDSYSVEIASKYYYRFYSISNPELNTSFKEIRRFKDIISFIDSEL